MIGKTHYEGYSFALFELAIENKKVALFKKQAELLIATLKSQPLYLELLSSYTIDFEVKQKLLKEAFKSKLDEIIYRLLFILIKRKRMHIVVSIFSLYIHHINSIAKVHEGTIFSPIKISALQLAKIEQKTSKRVGIEITLTNVIDKEIIAGFKIIIDDLVIDATILNQLESMKEEILRE